MTDNEIPKKHIFGKKEPIPEDTPDISEMLALVPSDAPRTNVLTSVVIIDEYVESLNEQIRMLQIVRSGLMNRAVEENIEEDSKAYVIKILGEKNRNPIVGDLLTKFKELHKATYDKIRSLQIANLNKSLSKKIEKLPDEELPLGLLDREVGKVAATEFTGYQPQSVRLEVRRKQGV